MTVDVAVPGAFTVDDVWRVQADWRAMRRAARRLQGEWPFVADELVKAAAVLRHGQELLAAVLERVEVPMTWQDDGRLTFFPHDAEEVATIRAAEQAAAEIQARLTAALARHRAALATIGSGS